jgi:hypothetical protein
MINVFKNLECYLILDHVNFGFPVMVVIPISVKVIDNINKAKLTNNITNRLEI